MNKEELIKNIGTIANSGTKAFMEKVKDSNLIGQFGVGFYSGFLVSNEISIITKKADSGYFKWTSDAGGQYVIEELTQDNLKEHIHPDYNLTQGTIIKCSLLDEVTDKYTDINKLKDIVKEHSQYINYPIKVFIKKEETKEVEDEEASLEEDVSVTEGSSNIDSSNLNDVTIEDVEEKPKKMKKITETIKEFQLINETKPIWTQSSN